MLRAVLDTNVFVSGLIRPAGPPGRILSHLLEKDSFVLVLSPGILLELRECVQDPKVRKYIDFEDQDLELLLVAVELLADLVKPTVHVEVVKEDPDDDHLLSTALEGRAGYLVSGDSHLLKLKEYEGIPILPPAAFLRILGRLHGG